MTPLRSNSAPARSSLCWREVYRMAPHLGSARCTALAQARDIEAGLLHLELAAQEPCVLVDDRLRERELESLGCVAISK
jgi:hypothetical protein